MNDEALSELIGAYREYILEDGGKNADRGLFALVREVERETRQKAMSLAYDLASKINDMHND